MVEETLTREEIKAALLVLLFQSRKAGDAMQERVYEHCFDLLEALGEYEVRNG